MAQQLEAVKHFDIYTQVYDSHYDIPSEIGETCVYLYTKESFWYKLINRILREHSQRTLTSEQVKTLGPFCWLLQLYLKQHTKTDIQTVYHGLNLTDEERQQFMPEFGLQFISFTSTSTNRAKAEKFGNTLLIIDLDVKKHLIFKDNEHKAGASISHLSDYPDEEEFLMWTGTWFDFVKYKYDNRKNKHIIYLKSNKQNKSRLQHFATIVGKKI